MTTAAQLIAGAQSQIGYVETGGASGHDGNITRYWAELDPAFQGGSWCAVFVSWCFIHAGRPLPAIDHAFGYTYCPDALTYARHAGLWSATGHYAPGDVVLYDFAGNGVADHTGIIVSDDGHSLHTIEGNTSSDAGGSQSNGGGVYAKVRAHGPTVLGAVTTSKLLAATPTLAPAPRGKPNPYPVPARTLAQGSSGNDVRFVQWAVGVPCDGAFGPQTTAAVRLFQQHFPACGGVDGVVGPHTLAVLRTITH